MRDCCHRSCHQQGRALATVSKGHKYLCRGPELNWRHMVLQTIALPTELPRRSPHFTRKLARESNVRATNGLGNHVAPGTQWSTPSSTIGPKPLRSMDVKT